MKERLELHFEGVTPASLRCVRLGISGPAKPCCVEAFIVHRAAPDERAFHWGRGIRALSLALLRLRTVDGESHRSRLLLAGGRGSAASTLDSLIHKADSLAWLSNVLATSRCDSPQKRLLRWFERQNSQLNNSDHPVRVFTRPLTGLRPEDISVHLPDRAASAADEREIERSLAASFGEGAIGLPAYATARPPVGRPSSASM